MDVPLEIIYGLQEISWGVWLTHSEGKVDNKEDVCPWRGVGLGAKVVVDLVVP